MKRQVFVLVAAVALLAGARAYAHHSQVAVYKTNEEQKIEGTLAQVMIRSPHSWIHVDTKDEKGQTKRYAIEWGGAIQLRNANVDVKTVKVDEMVRSRGRSR